MKRVTFILTILILVVSIFIIKIQSDNSGNSTVAILQKAFLSAGVKAVSSEIYVRGNLAAQGFESENARQMLMADIIAGVGADLGDEKPVFSHIQNDICEGNETDYIISDSNRIQISILKSNQVGLSREYQVSISMTDTSQKQEMETSVSRLMDTLKRFDMKPVINICIVGNLEGRLKDNELEAVCAKILTSARANKVEGMWDNDLISVSAFSPSIKEAVNVNGKQVNLNVAVRYNSYEGKTYIWLATPIITTEY